ncbi:MAG: hypothetical protein IKY53_02980 [Lachnospiraceae bacterium]|nr:hypothetical protein [Lachnospiraceae bacterium]
MKMIEIADLTIREASERTEFSMTFKEKMEVAKQLEKRKVAVVELPNVSANKTDALVAKSLAPIIKESVLSVCAGPDKAEIEKAWETVAAAAKPRIQIVVPTSPIQMEYVSGKKPAKMIEAIAETVAYAKSLCADVEFTAQDATRSESDFLMKACETAIENGATVINLCDTAGVMLPFEFLEFIQNVKSNVKGIENVKLSVTCSDELSVANANAFAVAAEIDQMKTTLLGHGAPALDTVVHTFTLRGDSLQAKCAISQAELATALRQMSWLGGTKKAIKSPFSETTGAQKHEEIELAADADISTVIKTVKSLGYELSDDDNAKVYKEFKRVSEKKRVGVKELEAIIASAALQVPPTYQLVDFVINSGNIITPMAQVTLDKNGTLLKGLSSGDGPIEAALLAIEMVIGHHYDLDDFQIQSITEGSEAIGSALVKLRANDKLFSGNGISTDIIGASIRAYINAINKIVYEENQNN